LYREDFDLDRALGLLLRQLLELEGGFALGGVRRRDVGQLDDDGVGGERPCAGAQQGGGDPAQGVAHPITHPQGRGVRVAGDAHHPEKPWMIWS
jgi:hypothetical protein